MRASFALFLVLSAAACRTSQPVTCASDAQCPVGSICDPAQGVCLAKAGACLPACDTAHVCNSGSLTCVAVTTADVTVTGPAAGAFASGTLPAAATAHAPGGVGGVRFDLSVGSTVVATAAGQASGTDPSSFAGTISLSSVADGAASLTATVTYATGSLASAPVSVTVDQTAPVVAMQTDGRTALFAATDVDTAIASITDATSGVQDSSVSLAIAGHAAVPGTATSAGVYAFAVTIDDSIAPAGATTVVPFSITARDRAGNLATLAGDPKEVIRVDRDAPLITGATYTPAPFVGATGHLIVSGAESVKATITDGAGVVASTVCLRIAGETSACPHPGVPGSANSYTFAIPAPAVSQDGTAATNFTIEADDTLAAHLTGASKAEHQARLAQTLYFDSQGPSITVLPDSTPYARTAVPIPVSALIVDPSGVPDGGVFLNGTLAPSFRDGGLFTFPLDARGLDAGTEGTYTFQVSAKDNVNNSSDAGGSRTIDDAPPTVSVRVFKDTDPGTPGVTYPVAAANTGWTGSSFIYSDTVHVKGTIADVSGIGGAALHVDGTELDGGVATGSLRPLGCTTGAKSCNFDVTVALNDLTGGNGTFHTGSGTSDAGFSGAAVPSGILTLTIDSSDQAKSADGTPAVHAGSKPSPVTANRLLWQQTVASGNVSGLAVHPSGDVIVTSSGTGNSVYDLAPDQPAVRWSFNAGLGVSDQPAIGAGDLNGAAIYVASNGGFVDALAPDGGVLWQADAGLATGANFAVGPAVDSAAWTDGGTVEQAVVPDNNTTGFPKLWAASSANSSTPFSVASDDVDTFSSPIVFNGFVWFGDGVDGVSGNVTRHRLVGDGSLGAKATVGGLQARPYWGLVTDGTNVFAATVRPTQGTRLDMYQITSGFTKGWDATGAHLSAEPTFGIDGKLAASSFACLGTATTTCTTVVPNAVVSKVTPSSGAFAQLLSLGAASGSPPTPFGNVPLQGSDGHVYLPVTGATAASVLALSGSQLSWQLLLPSAALAPSAAMDCGGRLFVGDGNTVYALVTDDHGLADTLWPNQRRDARNTGNANAPKYGIRTIGNVCQQ